MSKVKEPPLSQIVYFGSGYKHLHLLEGDRSAFLLLVFVEIIPWLSFFFSKTIKLLINYFVWEYVEAT